VFPARERPRLDLLRVAALYGANASGKSNVALALEIFQVCVAQSANVGFQFPMQPFGLDTVSGKDCAHLEITFLKDNVQYRYGFEARTQQNEQEIVSEWLYQATSSAETTLFERTGDQVKRGRRFAEGAALLNQGRLRRKNSLYLSLTAQLGGETASALVEHITKKVRVITGLNDKHLHTYTVDCLKQGRYRDGILRLIREADTGIPEINVPEEKDIEDIISIVEESFGSEVPHEEWEQIHAMAKRGLSVMAVHPVFGTDGQKVKTISFPMQWFESQGTQKLSLSPALF
jgi:hypothetical protein